MPSQLFDVIGNSLIWTWPVGVTSVICECLGGSGGGGAANANPTTGGGGRGGDYAKGTVTKGAETTLTIVVPPGGGAGVAGQSAAVQQGGVNKVLGAGANAGATAATASTNGAGGTGTNGTSIGTTIFAGGNGGVGNYTAGTGGSGAGGGAGGPTGPGGAASGNTPGLANTGAWLDGVARSGNGATGVGNSTPGINGSDFGGGGSGGKANSGTKRAGGTGSQGVVLLTWTAPAQAVAGVTIASGSVVYQPQQVAFPASQSVTTLFILSRAIPGPMNICVPTITVGGAQFQYAGPNWGQTISGISGTLIAIDMLPYRSTFSNPTDNFYYEICEGAWSGTVLATSVLVPTSSWPADSKYHWITVPLLSPTTLSAGTTYWIKGYLTRSADDATNQLSLGAVPVLNADSYAGGQLWDKTGSGLIFGSANYDMALRLHFSTPSHTITLAIQEVIGVGCASTAQLFAPSVAPAATTTLQRVQSSGKCSTTGASLNVPMPAPLTVGNGLVVMVTGFRSGGMTFGNAVRDAVGNTYRKVFENRMVTDAAYGYAVYLCPKITAATSVLTVTGVAGDQFVAAAVEYTGLGSGSLAWWSQSEASDTATTDASSHGTAVLSGEIAFAAMLLRDTATSSIVVQALTPPWVEEAEELTIAAVPCEMDSRVVALVNTSVSAVWAMGTAGDWSALILAFRVVSPQTIAGATITVGSSVTAPPFVVFPGPDQAVTGATRASTASVTAPTVSISTITTRLYDTFTDADGTNLTAHTMDIGPGWTVNTGSIQILNNRADGSIGPANAVSSYFSDAGVADGVVTLKLVVPPVFTNFGGGLTFRGSAWNDCWLAALEDDGAGPYIGIYERTGGVQTPRAGGPGPGNIAAVAGTIVTMKVTLDGPVMTLECGSGIVSCSSSVRLTDTHDGIWTYYGSSYVITPVDVFNVTGATVGIPDQTIFGASIAAGSVQHAPSVVAGGVTLLGATLASGAVLRAASVTPGPVAVGGATVVGAASVFVAAVTPGPVTVTGATVSRVSQTLAPAVTPGAVTVVGATRASTSLLLAPSVTTGPVTVQGVRITATTLLGPPTLTNFALGSIGTEFLASTASVYAPTVVGGLATILVPAISASATSHPPWVDVGAATILASTCAPTSALFVPSVTTGSVTVLGATCVATSQMFAMTVGAGPVAVGGSTRASSSVLFAPTVGMVAVTVGGSTLVSGSLVHVPVVTPAAVAISVSTIHSAIILTGPTVRQPVDLGITTSTILNAYGRMVVADGAVGYWRLYDGSLRDSVGTAHGAKGASVGTIAGPYDTALSFSGATGAANEATVPHAPALVLTGQGTLECWVKMPVTSTDMCFFAKGAYGITWAYGMAIYSNGNLLWRRSVGDYVANDAVLPRNRWVHLVMVATDSPRLLKLYIDGVLYTGTYSAFGAGKFFASTTEIMGVGFARSSTPSEYLNGALDEIAIYPTALTPAQVAARLTVGLFAPTVAVIVPVPVTVLAARIASGAVLRAPVVLPGPVTVQGATILSAGTGPFAPTITPPSVTLVGATCASTTFLSVPSVTTGPVTVMGATIVAYPQTIVTAGATHYWRLNESSGTGATDSVTNAVGVITGGVTLGEIGASGLPTAMLLAPTGKIAVGVITFGATAFTLEAWARIRTELEPEGRYLSAGQDAWPLHGMGVRNTIQAWPENILFAGQSDNIGYVRVVGTSALGRTWHHHVMAWGDRTIRLYVDGVLEYTSGVIDLMHADPYPYQIGDPQWDGWLENVAFYDRALTADEVSAHAALGRTASAFAAGIFAPTVAVEVRGSTIPTTASLAAPTVQAAAVAVIAGTLSRSSLTYPPGILVPIQGVTIPRGSSLAGPRVSLVDDQQPVIGAFILNDAGTSRVMDVFDLLVIGPWLKTVGIYAPDVWLPPLQTVKVDPILQGGGVYAPSSLTIVPIAAASILSASRVFLPIVAPGGVEVGSPPFLPTAVVVLPPAVANPDRFGALTGVSAPSTLGALAVANLNPLTGATTPTALGAVVARVSGIVTGVLTPTALATGTVTASVPLPGALGVTVVGTVQHSTDAAVLRGVIAGAVLKPLAVQIVAGASGLEIAGALGVLSAPRFATVTGVPAQTQLALLSAGVVLSASPVLAAGDIGILDAFNGVFVFATGVAATATSAALGSQRTIAIAALPAAVPALGTVGRTLTVALPALPTTGQIGALGAQSLYTQAVTGVAAQSTVGAVTRVMSVPLTAAALIATAGVVSTQQRVAGIGAATSAALAPVLPEHLHLLVPALSVGGLGTLSTTVEHVPVTVALVGAAATGDMGVFAPTSTRALTTVLTGTARGALGTATDTAVTGAASLSTLGLAKPGVQIVVPAVTEIGTVGALGITRVWAVTGVRGLPTVGALGHQTDAALLGLITTTDVTTLSPAPGLSGVTATGAVGTLGTARTRSTDGVSVHAAAGIVAVRTDVVPTTVSATGDVGDLVVLHQLVGVSASSAPGALAVTVDRVVPAVSGATAVGTLRRATVVGLVGVETATAVGTVSTGADVTAALLNVRAWGTVGTLGHALDLTIAPAEGTSAVGVSVARPMPALIGVTTTSAVDTGTVAVAPRLAGAVGQGRVGALGTTLGRTTTVGLTGVEASGEVGRLGVTRAWQTGLTGVGASVSAGAVAVAVAPALTWVYVIGRIGRVGLTVDGVRTLTGVEADISQGNIGIVTRTLLTTTGATGRTGLLAGAGERLVTLTPAVGMAHIGIAHPLIQMPVVGVITTTASADALGVEAALTLRGIRAIASPGVIGVTGADAPPEIIDFTVVVKREEMLTATVETVLDGWCVVCRAAETVVEVEPEPDYFSPVIIQRAPALHPLSVVAVKPEYLDVTVAVTQAITVEALRSGVVDEVHLSRQLDLDASLDADLDVSVRILIEQTYAVETER
jgi:hypothetical protein